MTETIDRPDAAATPPRRRGLPRLQEAGLVLVVLALGTLLSIVGYRNAMPGAPNTFLNPENLVVGVTQPMSYFAIMAVGMTCVIVTGGIDISVASIMALSGLVTAATLQAMGDRGTSPWLVAPVSALLPLAIGLACGLFNGAMIVGLRMHPFIVTLGTLSIFRGIANVLPFESATLPATRADRAGLPPGSVTHLFKQLVLGQPLWAIIATAIVLALGHVFLRHTIWGRETYAVGGNEEAARFSGIHVGRAKLRVYAISGTLAGLAGLVSLGRFGSMSTDSANGYELTVVAAAVVGGASLAGGRGTAVGAILGTLVLALIENGIYIVDVNQNFRLIIVGGSIIVAVALERLSDAVRARRAARRALR